jgi:hypothetical protein
VEFAGSDVLPEMSVSVREGSGWSNTVSKSSGMLDALGRLELQALTLSLRSCALVVHGSFDVYIGAAVAAEVYVGGRLVRAESRLKVKLELELKGLNLRRDMVG